MKNREVYIDNFIKTCLLRGYSQEYTKKLVNGYLERLPEVFDFKERFCEFLKIQKAIEPKWSYHEKFYQKVINDYDYFLQPMQELLDVFMLEAPPRTGKTELVTGFGVPYLISQSKNRRFAIVSGNQALKRKLRKTITRIIKSNYFLEKYKIRLTIDNSIEIQTSNDCLVLFTTTLSEVPTGEGFHYIFMEDALTHTMIKSPAKTENAFEQIDGLLTRTQDDPRTKIIINNQRLGFNDLSAKIEEGYEKVGRPILRITMPYYFENETIFTDKNNNEYIFKENEFLISRFDNLKKDLIIGKIGKSEFTTQYMQNPVDNENAYIKKEYLSNRYTLTPQQLLNQNFFDNIIISMDMASKTKESNDYTAFICIGIKSGVCYVLDVIRQKTTSPLLYQEASDFYFKWSSSKQPIMLIEDKSSGEYVISKIRQEGVFDKRNGERFRPILFPINPQGKKETRLVNVLHYFQDNKVLLPKNAEWLLSFESELLSFPRDKHDDMVDALTQALNFYSSQPNFNQSSISII